ncbi:MAG: hypothetical protein K0Q79_2194 [Flavipsychrobacter sp.]|jgi:aminopeptidase N|nr:hypothetical protein [Flavipsychrobacter sp.]
MKYSIFSIVILLIINQLTYAQEDAAGFECSLAKHRKAARVTVGDIIEEKYDVKHVKFDLQLSNDTTYIDGTVTTTAKVLAPGFNLYVFELDNGLVVDTVLINGVGASLTTFGDIRIVTMPSILTTGNVFAATVKYHGYPNGAGTIFSGIGGLNTKRSPTWGARITFTQSEAYHAKEWWPCKQSLQDKIDSVDIWVTVPDSLKAGSNGVLTNVTTVDATHKRYEWKSRHPIAYYLISVAVANYVEYSYYMHYSGSMDSMLVQNYVYSNPLTLSFFKDEIDSVGMFVDHFSKLYSRYPYWDEKYGHCMAPLQGGMENQTMTTIGFFEGWVIAHELGHQWFGDNVTCATWADIFVNEGFASYTEALYREHFHGRAGMVDDIVRKQANVRRYDTGSIYVPAADTANEGRTFDNRLTYHKGACLLHMLRHVVNNDSILFHAFRSYQQEHKEGNATIDDFKTAVKSVVGNEANGINIDTFFRQWAYGEGFPVYSAKWNQKNNEVYVQLNQMTKVPSSVSCFTVPMEIKVYSPVGDTMIRVNNYEPNQLYHFTWKKPASSISLDPENWLLDSVASITKDVTLTAAQVVEETVRIYPNPTNGSWHIVGLSENSSLVLTDVTGRVLWQKNNATSNDKVPANDLPVGVYMLKVNSEGAGDATYKLIKL